jgi:hypothetical protein
VFEPPSSLLALEPGWRAAGSVVVEAGGVEVVGLDVRTEVMTVVVSPPSGVFVITEVMMLGDVDDEEEDFDEVDEVVVVGGRLEKVVGGREVNEVKGKLEAG